MRRSLAGLSVLIVVVGVATAGLGVSLLPRSDGGRALASQPVPVLDPSRPLTILVPGWLWDPKSRRPEATLDDFSERLNRELEARYGMTTAIVQYSWSRIPADVIEAERDFGAYVGALVDQQLPSGCCINFLGHSVGAAMVYGAAARGTPIGYLGTLGLPTIGRGRPPAVMRWVNFYTTTHRDDVAGSLWGGRAGADVNIDLRVPHHRFWEATETIEESASAIAATWFLGQETACSSRPRKLRATSSQVKRSSTLRRACWPMRCAIPGSSSRPSIAAAAISGRRPSTI